MGTCAANISHSRNVSDANSGNKPVMRKREILMENVRRYRALASLCRQQAAYRPLQSWDLLGQAEHFEHLAEAELKAHFEACNAQHATVHFRSSTSVLLAACIAICALKYPSITLCAC